ncbi:MAG: MBL fold metallo-hydrolase [Ruminococcaceae bacterium]|nr:MBL fold metallo-hydrolase [Oscillospiraceae bacterium]
MTIRFLGQSGYVLKTKNSEIIIDPYLSDSVNRVAGRPRTLPIPIEPKKIHCDAVICTHNHLDHLDPDTVSQIKNKQLFITTNEGEIELNRLGKDNVVSLNVGESTVVGDFEITAVFADHTVEAFGLIIKAENRTLYFSGDTLYNEKLFQIANYHPDVTLICINGKLGNMNVEEALTVAKKIGAPLSIPNHYDMFASNCENPHLFADHIDGGFIMEFDREYQL